MKKAFERMFDVLAARWWGVFVLAVPLAIVGSFYRSGILAQSGSFMPNLPEMIHSGIFFVFGWAVYRNRDVLLAQYARHCWKYALAGVVTYSGAAVLPRTCRLAPRTSNMSRKSASKRNTSGTASGWRS